MMVQPMDLDAILVNIIAYAGDSKSNSFSAIEAAKGKDFEEAQELLRLSRQSLLKAHGAHADLLAAEANGNGQQITFMFVHASNHVSIAEITLEFAGVIVDLYKRGGKDV